MVGEGDGGSGFVETGLGLGSVVCVGLGAVRGAGLPLEIRESGLMRKDITRLLCPGESVHVLVIVPRYVVLPLP